MALPITVPATTPPSIPAPTTQPKQPAFAGGGGSQCGKADARGADKRNQRLVHVFSSSDRPGADPGS